MTGRRQSRWHRGKARTVLEQELVVHAFAPLDGPDADAAYGQMSQLWARCTSFLDTREPIAGTGLPPDLPADRAVLPKSTAVAARQSPDSTAMALAWTEHDLVGLSVMLTHLAGRPTSTRWSELDRRWDAVAEVGTGELLGVARLYLGKLDLGPVPHTSQRACPRPVAATAELAHSVVGALPVTPEVSTVDSGWPGRGLTVADGFAVWEVSPVSLGRIERRALVLAALGCDPQLSAWVWSRGDNEPTPLAQYLMHAAKIHFQGRVYQRADPVSRLCDRVDQAIARLLPYIETPPTDHAKAAAMGDDKARLRAERVRVTLARTDLDDMRRSIGIAKDNTRVVLRGNAPSQPGPHTMFGADLSLADHLVGQLDHDVAYLGNALARTAACLESIDDVERASERTGPPRQHRSPHRAALAHEEVEVPTFGIITAMPEEFTAMKALLDDVRDCPVSTDAGQYVLTTAPGLVPDHPHQVVLTLMADTATVTAAVSCVNLVNTFPSVDQVIMVGIAAGIPDLARPRQHVRLGDIVVATWGIVDYDHVVQEGDAVTLRQPFPRPSPRLSAAARMIESMELAGERPWQRHLSRGATRLPEFGRPPAATDRMLTEDEPPVQVPHPDLGTSGHHPELPKVHYGLIGSADRSLRSGTMRDELAQRYGLRALEMEGKGVGNAAFLIGRQWFMVRGVSDYANRHMNLDWRRYAALVAAAYTRALLERCSPITPRQR